MLIIVMMTLRGKIATEKTRTKSSLLNVLTASGTSEVKKSVASPLPSLATPLGEDKAARVLETKKRAESSKRIEGGGSIRNAKRRDPTEGR